MKSKRAAEAPVTDRELQIFLDRLNAGDFDDRLFEEIRKLRAEHLARVCRMLAKRKFEEQ